MGVVLPMALLFSRLREKDSWLFFSALLVVVGFVVNRLNVAITGMANSDTYFPKWTELIVTLALVVLGFTIFAMAVKHLGVFPKHELRKPASPLEEERHPIFTGNVVLGIWVVVLLGTITYGMANMYQQNNGEQPATNGNSEARAAEPMDEELDLPEDFVYPVGEDSPGPVTFSHESHVLMQETPTCASCHATTFSILKDGELDPESVTMEAMYEGESCGVCHDGEKAFSAEECEACHVME